MYNQVSIVKSSTSPIIYCAHRTIGPWPATTSGLFYYTYHEHLATNCLYLSQAF